MTLRQALKTGRVNRVPVTIGTERDEDLVGEPTTPSEYVQSVDSQYLKYAPRVLALYPLSHFEAPFIAWRTLAADSDTVCPAIVTDEWSATITGGAAGDRRQRAAVLAAIPLLFTTICPPDAPWWMVGCWGRSW